MPIRSRRKRSVRKTPGRMESRRRKSKRPEAIKGRRGRITTAEKLAMATLEESTCPAEYSLEQCTFRYSRVAWRIINGQAVLVAYHIYVGSDGRVPQVPGVPKRGEFGSEIATRIFMLITKPFEQPHRRMSLLRRSGIIDFQDLPNSVQHRRKFRKTLSLPPTVFRRLTPPPLQDLTNFVPRMMKLTCNLTNAHPVPMSSTYPTLFVRRQHP